MPDRNSAVNDIVQFEQLIAKTAAERPLPVFVMNGKVVDDLGQIDAMK
jgi:hypothetical protein